MSAGPITPAPPSRPPFPLRDRSRATPARPPCAGSAGIAAAVAGATSLDGCAGALLRACARLPGVRRAGLALVRGAGRELGFASSDDDAVGGREVRWCSIDALARLPLPDAVASGRMVHLADPDALLHAYPGFGQRQLRLGASSVTALPLDSGGERLGALLLSWADPYRLDGVRRALLEALATTTAAGLARAAAAERRERTARAWQRGLLPPALPDLPGLAFGAAWQPATEVGGDWYDAFGLPDGRAVLAVGDVVGRGSGAAAVMADVRAALRAYALVDADPARVLAHLHAFVESAGDPERLVTLALAVVDAAREHVDVALAGHPPPLLLDPDGARVVAAAPGPPLGVAPGPWPVHRERLAPAAVLALCSDGLVESATVPASDGLRRLGAALTSLGATAGEPRTVALRAASALESELHGELAVADDRTLLLAASTRGREVRRRTLTLDPVPSAPGAARHGVAAAFSTWELDADAAHPAQLCVSELVTNAVVHAGTGAIDVTVQLEGDRVLLLVADAAPEGAPPAAHELHPPDPEAAGGRGLVLVDALSRAWGSRRPCRGRPSGASWPFPRAGLTRRCARFSGCSHMWRRGSCHDHSRHRVRRAACPGGRRGGRPDPRADQALRRPDRRRRRRTRRARRASSAASWGRTAPGRPRRSGCSSGWSGPPQAAAACSGRALEYPSAYLGEVGALIEGPAFYARLSGADNLAVLARAGRGRWPRAERCSPGSGSTGRGADRYRSVLARHEAAARHRRRAARPTRDLLILDEPTNGLDPAGHRARCARSSPVPRRGA